METVYGRPCRHCGGTERYAKNRVCVNANLHRSLESKQYNNARRRERRAADPVYRDRVNSLRNKCAKAAYNKDPQKKASYHKHQMVTNPRYRESVRRVQRNWRVKNRDALQAQWSRANAIRYGIPEATRPKPSNCELCARVPEKGALHRDHGHTTKRFRGWLCPRCNLLLGMLEKQGLYEGLLLAIAVGCYLDIDFKAHLEQTRACNSARPQLIESSA